MFRPAFSRSAAPVRSFSTTQAASKPLKSLLKELERQGLPSPPKAPSNAYAIFVREEFKKNKGRDFSWAGGENPVAGFTAEIGSKWTDLPKDAQKPYWEQAEAEKKEYLKAFKEFKATLLPGQEAAIERVTGKSLRYPYSASKYKAEEREASGMPKRPLTAFFIYIQEFRQDPEAQGLAATAISQKAAEKWKSFSAEKKKPYLDRAEADQKEYKTKLDAWKASQA